MARESDSGTQRIIAADRHVMDSDLVEEPSPIRVRALLWTIAIIWVAKIPVIRLFADWPLWCSKPQGAFGWGASLLSTSLAILFVSQLFRSGHEIASRAAFQPLRRELHVQLSKIRSSRVPVVVASLAAVIAGAVFTMLWTTGHTAFASMSWFLSDVPIACACTFALSYLISCSAGCIVAVLRLDELDASLNPLHAEPENSIAAVSGIVTLALTRIVLAAAPLVFHPLMSSSYEFDRQMVSVGVTGSIVLIVLVAYCIYVFKIRGALVVGQSEARTILHRKWQHVMSGSMQLDSREHVQLESLALLAEHVRRQPRWPFEHQGLVKLGTALMIAAAPVIIEHLLA